MLEQPLTTRGHHRCVRGPAAAAGPVKVGTTAGKVSREHTVASPAPGLVDHRGRQAHHLPRDGQGRGRLRDRQPAPARCRPSPTTCRSSAPRDPRAASDKSNSRAVRLVGGPRVDHLLHRYGALLSEVIDLVDADPELGRTAALGAERTSGRDRLRGVSHEGALHLDDILMHRTRPNYEQADKGVEAPRRSPTSSRRCSAGTPRRRSTRCSTTARGTPRNATRQEQQDDRSRRCGSARRAAMSGSARALPQPERLVYEPASGPDPRDQPGAHVTTMSDRREWSSGHDTMARSSSGDHGHRDAAAARLPASSRT